MNPLQFLDFLHLVEIVALCWLRLVRLVFEMLLRVSLVTP